MKSNIKKDFSNINKNENVIRIACLKIKVFKMIVELLKMYLFLKVFHFKNNVFFVKNY